MHYVSFDSGAEIFMRCNGGAKNAQNQQKIARLRFSDWNFTWENLNGCRADTHTHIMSIIGFELQFGPQLVVRYVKLGSSDFYTFATDGLTIRTSGGYFDVW